MKEFLWSFYVGTPLQAGLLAGLLASLALGTPAQAESTDVASVAAPHSSATSAASATPAIADAPPALSVIGDIGLLRRPAVALVGARNASMNGRNLARRLAGELTQAGIVIVSGLARGSDGAAHQGALDAGGGTVAAVAGGVDVVYPREHEGLPLALGERGAVVAESPLGAEPTARAFPRRNRIISGLTQVSVIVEAALRSGSLITARTAAEQGREVGAVPGSPLDPRCQGANRLIKDGAALIEEAGDIVALIAQSRPPVAMEPTGRGYAADGPGADDDAVEKARQGLCELLSPSPVLVDELVRVLHLSPAAVQTALLELELAGRLERLGGGRVAAIPAEAN